MIPVYPGAVPMRGLLLLHNSLYEKSSPVFKFDALAKSQRATEIVSVRKYIICDEAISN